MNRMKKALDRTRLIEHGFGMVMIRLACGHHLVCKEKQSKARRYRCKKCEEEQQK